MRIKRSIRMLVASLVIMAAGCMERKQPDNVSALTGDFSRIDAFLARSNLFVARDPVDAFALPTRAGAEYRIYEYTNAEPTRLHLQVSLSSESAIFVDYRVQSSTGNRQQISELKKLAAEVTSELKAYWRPDE